MFGYIQPYKPELKIKEFDVYKSVYCGLCKDMGILYGRFFRFFLSYDFTFLSLLSVSLSDENFKTEVKRCSVNPLKKKNCLIAKQDIKYASAVAVIFINFKFKDDLLDNSSHKKLLYKSLYNFSKKGVKKVNADFPELYGMVKELMDMQIYTESQKNPSLDFSAEPTAAIMSNIMKSIGSTVTERKVLSKFGYFLGKWIYLIDAIDDIDKDLDGNNYNAFIIKYNITKESDKNLREKVFDSAEKTLNLILSQIKLCFELLDIKHNREILENIIYLGLGNMQKDILKKRRKEINDK